MPSQRYTEGPPAFRAASLVPLDSTRTWAFPWILSSAVPAFLESLARGSLEQPPKAASVSTRKQKMRELRFIRRALAFETFSSESEGITEHDRSQRVGQPNRHRACYAGLCRPLPIAHHCRQAQFTHPGKTPPGPIHWLRIQPPVA